MSHEERQCFPSMPLKATELSGLRLLDNLSLRVRLFQQKSTQNSWLDPAWIK